MRNDIVELANAEISQHQPDAWRWIVNIVLAPFFAVGWVSGMSYWTVIMIYRAAVAGFRQGAAEKFTR